MTVPTFLRNGNCACWPQIVQWALLAFFSLIFAGSLEFVRLPAALLLGPMAAAIAVAMMNARIRVARPPYALAQALVGCLIAKTIPLSVLGEVMADWPVFFGGVLAVIVASNFFGWLLGRLRVLPGADAIWGSSPGGATAMTVIAEDYGADVRLVAVMQYLRVIFVALAAALVAGHYAHVATTATDWLAPVDGWAVAATLVFAAVCAAVARFVRIPGGTMLLPLFGGILLHGILPIELPPALLAISYAIIGWSIGLRFTRPILRNALHVLPQIVGAILALIAFCGLFAAGLVWLGNIDPLTAYLATSPGGMDTVAIIAASSHADMPFVMAMQTVRILLVLATGPSLARFLTARLNPPNTHGKSKEF